jgi:uncharacterized membrane protein
MGTQKSAVSFWSLGRDIYRQRAGRRLFLIWSFGLFQVCVGMTLLPVAISQSSLSLVAPLSGTGLVVLALFSRFLLGEQLVRVEICGLTVVLSGTLWLGMHLKEPSPSPVDPWWLGVALALSVIATIGATLLALGQRGPWVGPLLSASAAVVATGALLCPRMFAQEVQALEEVGWVALGALLVNPFVHLYVILNCVALLPLQMAYQRGRAVVVIPTYSAIYLVLPVLAGLSLLGEQVVAQQWVGIVVVLAGALILTVGGQREKAAMAA